jgi:hypothetical protein
MAERTEDSRREVDRETEQRELLRAQRRFLTTTDLMALMMVAATAMTAFATWRTYRISDLVLQVSERPFLGVQQVTFERVNTAQPIIVVDLRNFGAIPAEAATVTVTSSLDGKAIPRRKGEMTDDHQGVVSPGVPHYLYVFLQPDEYQKAVSGAASLTVQVSIVYKGPALGRIFCLTKNVFYDYNVGAFRGGGGSSECSTDQKL